MAANWCQGTAQPHIVAVPRHPESRTLLSPQWGRWRDPVILWWVGNRNPVVEPPKAPRSAPSSPHTEPQGDGVRHLQSPFPPSLPAHHQSRERGHPARQQPQASWSSTALNPASQVCCLGKTRRTLQESAYQRKKKVIKENSVIGSNATRTRKCYEGENFLIKSASIYSSFINLKIY